MPDPDNFAIDMRGFRSHWLADVAMGGASPVLPNDYWGKEGIKLTDTCAYSSPTGAVWTFASKNLGIHYTGRQILALICFGEKASADVPSAFAFTIKIGDAAVAGPFNPTFWQGGSGNIRFTSTSVVAALPNGTTGDIVVTATTATGLTIANVKCTVKLLSLSTLQYVTDRGQSVGSGSVVNDGLNPFNVNDLSSMIVHGIVMCTGAHTLTISGATEKGETDLGNNTRLVWGWNTRMAANPTTNVSIATTGVIVAASSWRSVWTPTPP